MKKVKVKTKNTKQTKKRRKKKSHKYSFMITLKFAYKFPLKNVMIMKQSIDLKIKNRLLRYVLTA